MSTEREKTPAPVEQAEPIDGPPAAIHWRSWPAVEQMGRTGLVVLALVAAAVVIRAVTGHVVLALLGLAALLIALWRYFLPVHYELNGRGVDHWAFGVRRHVPWSAIVRYEVGRTGVLLVPNEDRSAMSALAGMFLPFAENDEAVLLRLRYYLGSAKSG